MDRTISHVWSSNEKFTSGWFRMPRRWRKRVCIWCFRADRLQKIIRAQLSEAKSILFAYINITAHWNFNFEMQQKKPTRLIGPIRADGKLIYCIWYFQESSKSSPDTETKKRKNKIDYNNNWEWRLVKNNIKTAKYNISVKPVVPRSCERKQWFLDPLLGGLQSKEECGPGSFKVRWTSRY